MSPTQGAALHALASRLARLPRDPEAYVVELDDIIRTLRRIANVSAPRSGPSYESAERGTFASGLIAVDRRLVRVEKRRRRIPANA